MSNPSNDFLEMGDPGLELAFFCQQARPQVEGWGYQSSHKLFGLQIGLACRVCWAWSLEVLSSMRPKRFHTSTDGSRYIVPRANISESSGSSVEEGEKLEGPEIYQENRDHGINSLGLVGESQRSESL